MKTAETLNEKLFAKADFELSEKLEALFKPIADFAWNDSDARGKMKNAPKDLLTLNGYGNFTSDPWPPSVVCAGQKALFEGMKEAYRDQYVANFIAKVDSLGEQIESLQQEIQQ